MVANGVRDGTGAPPPCPSPFQLLFVTGSDGVCLVVLLLYLAAVIL